MFKKVLVCVMMFLLFGCPMFAVSRFPCKSENEIPLGYTFVIDVVTENEGENTILGLRRPYDNDRMYYTVSTHSHLVGYSNFGRGNCMMKTYNEDKKVYEYHIVPCGL